MIFVTLEIAQVQVRNLPFSQLPQETTLSLKKAVSNQNCGYGNMLFLFLQLKHLHTATFVTKSKGM